MPDEYDLRRAGAARLAAPLFMNCPLRLRFSEARRADRALPFVFALRARRRGGGIMIASALSSAAARELAVRRALLFRGILYAERDRNMSPGNRRLGA